MEKVGKGREDMEKDLPILSYTHASLEYWIELPKGVLKKKPIGLLFVWFFGLSGLYIRRIIAVHTVWCGVAVLCYHFAIIVVGSPVMCKCGLWYNYTRTVSKKRRHVVNVEWRQRVCLQRSKSSCNLPRYEECWIFNRWIFRTDCGITLCCVSLIISDHIVWCRL